MQCVVEIIFSTLPEAEAALPGFAALLHVVREEEQQQQQRKQLQSRRAWKDLFVVVSCVCVQNSLSLIHGLHTDLSLKRRSAHLNSLALSSRAYVLHREQCALAKDSKQERGENRVYAGKVFVTYRAIMYGTLAFMGGPLSLSTLQLV